MTNIDCSYRSVCSPDVTLRPRVFLVFGLARSGTSMVAHLVHALGIPMGEAFKEGDPDWCKYGLWEDAHFDALTRQLFDSNIAVDSGRILSCDQPSLLDDFKALVQARNASYEMWGVKNLLIPWCLYSFEELARPHELSLIYCWREPYQSIESHARRQQKSPFDVARDAGVALLLNGKLFALHRGPKIKIDYELSLNDPDRCVRELADFCGVPFRPELTSIIDSRQQRFH